MDTPTFSVERIAPNVAKQMLERVFSSAKVDTSSRESFTRDMAAGGWVLNGAPIVFGTDGSLLDGRARLHACIDSGATFETLVIRGIANDTFESIDAIRKRTLADILSIRQEQHGRPLGAALRILWSYGLGNGSGGKSPSPTALLALLEQKPQIRDSVMPALRAVPLLPHGCAIALHHLASAINPVKATLFLTQLQEPTIEAPNHPVVQLRQVLLQMRSQGGTRKQAYMLAIAVKAWNAFEAGKPIKALRFGAGEKFPRVQSLDWGPLSQVEKNLPANAPAATITTKLNVRLVTITPDIAEKMLDGRAPNRSVSSAVLNKYARDMAVDRRGKGTPVAG
ncbi:hypothetical protein [Sphingomonas pseudosanguinis]|uniref:Uncharacterized protein n=1 Tax=Sphingomonas pseudosanguinis TaxID=413712 RepID=A0A7W6AAD9_9SPHN|nr:hypothetical protein [Sphingomonas pseudosanguinis]MBB3878799.1 hypothetical protein [Sphingomonas pseudosanguinis]MBN3535950.1 hypothetical protein [Sphingomonas pseudosanguinis]